MGGVWAEGWIAGGEYFPGMWDCRGGEQLEGGGGGCVKVNVAECVGPGVLGGGDQAEEKEGEKGEMVERHFRGGCAAMLLLVWDRGMAGMRVW